jgi:hypothetical protein
MARGQITDPFKELLARHKALHDAQTRAGTPGRDGQAPATGQEELIPVESYLSTGRTPPPGTPRQTRWAIDIKTELWHQLAPLLKARMSREKESHCYHALLALAQVGYPPEVAPLLRAIYVVHRPDQFDQKPAKVWIEIEVEAREGRCSWGGRPVTRAEFALRRLMMHSIEPIEEYLKRHPTPDDWRDELRRRGLRFDETVTVDDRKVFASFDPGKRAAVALDAAAGARRTP